MKEVKKILFSTDFSPTSNDAMELALLLKNQLNANLEVVHVFDERAFEVPAPYYFMPGVDEWLDKHFSGLREKGRKALSDLCENQLKGCSSHFLEGRPGKTIVKIAKENGFDMIVFGTHGYRGWDRMVLGSVADYVVKHAHCTTVTVKPPESPK